MLFLAECNYFGFMDKEQLAKTICEKLSENGYCAYYAGGYVRDIILGIESDDIDIATDAPPEKVQSLFEKTILVGLAFGIVVVVEGGVSFEVATFRRDLSYKDGRRPEKIAFCSPKEDAERRDFTINGMFFDPLTQKIYDYVGGQEDIEKKVIRAIGNPVERFTEDRLRMIRACRFAARFNFEIEKETQQAILLKADELLPAVSIERVYQEFQKMKKHHFKKALQLLFEMNLLQQIFEPIQKYSLDEFMCCLKAFDRMPEDCPTILYIMELFPQLDESELQTLVDFLKVSNVKANLALFCLQSKKMIPKNPTLTSWVHFYAHPDSDLILKVIAAPLSEQKSVLFQDENEKRKQILFKAIERKKNNEPVINSTFLMKQGVMPGKKLGLLLKKAEEISIEKDLSDPEAVLKELHKLELWGE